MTPFWMIWTPDGTNPTYRHNTETSARAEAERLARAFPGTEFYVMAGVASCRMSVVVWSEKTDARDIPF